MIKIPVVCVYFHRVDKHRHQGMCELLTLDWGVVSAVWMFTGTLHIIDDSKKIVQQEYSCQIWGYMEINGRYISFCNIYDSCHLVGHRYYQQLGAGANFDDLVKFGDRRQIRRPQMFIKLAFEFGCDVILMSHPITRSLGSKLQQTSIFPMKYSFFTNQTAAVW